MTADTSSSGSWDTAITVMTTDCRVLGKVDVGLGAHVLTVDLAGEVSVDSGSQPAATGSDAATTAQCQ